MIVVDAVHKVVKENGNECKFVSFSEIRPIVEGKPVIIQMEDYSVSFDPHGGIIAYDEGANHELRRRAVIKWRKIFR